MSAVRPRLSRAFAAALATVAMAAGCEVATKFDRDLIADGADGGDASSDATLDGPTGTDAPLGGDGPVGADSSADSSVDVAAGDSGKNDAGNDGAAEAAADGAPGDANGFDVVVDGSGFFDAAGDGGACNTLVNGGAQVQQIDVASARPAATGGNIVDGTYFKTADVVYTGPGGGTGLTGYVVRETLLVTNSSTGTALLTSTFTDTSGTTTERITMTPTSGTGATTLTFVCPAYGPSPTFFNVRTGDAGQIELDIFITTDRIETFVRQ